MRFFNEKKEAVNFIITMFLILSFGFLNGVLLKIVDVTKGCEDIYEDVKQIEDYFVKINSFKSIIEISNITEIYMSVDEFDHIFGVDDSLSEKVKMLQSNIETIREPFVNNKIVIFLSISVSFIVLSIIIHVVFYDMIENGNNKK